MQGFAIGTSINDVTLERGRGLPTFVTICDVRGRGLSLVWRQTSENLGASSFAGFPYKHAVDACFCAQCPEDGHNYSIGIYTTNSQQRTNCVFRHFCVFQPDASVPLERRVLCTVVLQALNSTVFVMEDGSEFWRHFGRGRAVWRNVTNGVIFSLKMCNVIYGRRHFSIASHATVQ